MRYRSAFSLRSFSSLCFRSLSSRFRWSASFCFRIIFLLAICRSLNACRSFSRSRSCSRARRLFSPLLCSPRVVACVAPALFAVPGCPLMGPPSLNHLCQDSSLSRLSTYISQSA
jgi:hypothetical protein